VTPEDAGRVPSGRHRRTAKRARDAEQERDDLRYQLACIKAQHSDLKVKARDANEFERQLIKAQFHELLIRLQLLKDRENQLR
jgi:hypothetical protein